MDDQRVGSVLRALRRRRQWRQADVAARAGVSQATISRVERGHVDGFSLRCLRAVAAVLDARLDLAPRWRGGELERLLDARHSALAGFVAEQLKAAGWNAAPEASYSIYGERGSVDLLAWHRPSHSLLVVEVKTQIVDLQDLLGSVDRKRRLAPAIAAERGWRGASRTSVWVVLSDTRTNRRRLAAHRALLRAAFPADGRTIAAWLRVPANAMAALSFMPEMRPQHGRPDLRGSSRVRGRIDRPRSGIIGLTPTV